MLQHSLCGARPVPGPGRAWTPLTSPGREPECSAHCASDPPSASASPTVMTPVRIGALLAVHGCFNEASGMSDAQRGDKPPKPLTAVARAITAPWRMGSVRPRSRRPRGWNDASDLERSKYFCPDVLRPTDARPSLGTVGNLVNDVHQGTLGQRGGVDREAPRPPVVLAYRCSSRAPNDPPVTTVGSATPLDGFGRAPGIFVQPAPERPRVRVESTAGDEDQRPSSRPRIRVTNRSPNVSLATSLRIRSRTSPARPAVSAAFIVFV